MSCRYLAAKDARRDASREDGRFCVELGSGGLRLGRDCCASLLDRLGRLGPDAREELSLFLRPFGTEPIALRCTGVTRLDEDSLVFGEGLGRAFVLLRGLPLRPFDALLPLLEELEHGLEE